MAMDKTRKSAGKISGKNASMSKHPNTAKGENTPNFPGATVAKPRNISGPSGKADKMKMSAGKYG